MNYNNPIPTTMSGSEPALEPICEKEPSLTEMLVTCDNTLGECLQIANNILMTIIRDTMGPMDLDEPGCVIDSAHRCFRSANMLLEALRMIQVRIG